ncbi:hypothetical protein PYW07_016751 [Mythimna separata]|uniref:BPTI/Kunitz inhibitor domain-containing protein n=1 Tax=Mythimna separata TaxID=271217 RepID=A0AAD8DT14_MYTSE|nr:hypothetical protein PYW07_016751 [Mythimna separata]
MKADILWWIFYFYICNVQRIETVKIFKRIATPPHVYYTTYKPSVVSKTCMLIPEHGPCRDTLSMWYFDPGANDCQKFDWGGCQGNGNRFDNISACLNFCLSKEGSKIRPRYCNLHFDYGFCFGSTTRWYYDPRWKVCKSTIYSGCGGNKNNFYNKEQCDQICRFGNGPIESPTREDVEKPPERQGMPLSKKFVNASHLVV